MSVAELLRTEIDALTAAVGSRVAEEIPGYAAETDRGLRRLRRRVLERGLLGLVDELEARTGADAAAMDWQHHRALGRLECHRGRPITEMLHAPWVASRAILRFARAHAAEAGLTAADLHGLAEVVIDWSDRISREMSHGFNEELAARVGELESRHRALIEAALEDPPVSLESLAVTAADAGWQLPRELRVVVAEGVDRSVVRRRVPAGTPVADIDGALVALVAEPLISSELFATTSAAEELVAAAGPPFPVNGAHASARIARRAIGLARRGVLPNTGVVDCTEHELALLVLADEDLAHRVRDGVLAALGGTTSLSDTLAAWFAHGSRLKPTAAALDVHTHTVTYRLNRARDLVGSAVDDPDRRLALHVATFIDACLRR